jgi:hypothetical protein
MTTLEQLVVSLAQYAPTNEQGIRLENLAGKLSANHNSDEKRLEELLQTLRDESASKPQIEFLT